MSGFGSLAPDEEPLVPPSSLPEWWNRGVRSVGRWWDSQNQNHPINRGVIDAYRYMVPPGKPDWYNPQPSQGPGEIVTPDRRAQMMPPNGGQDQYGQTSWPLSKGAFETLEQHQERVLPYAEGVIPLVEAHEKRVGKSSAEWSAQETQRFQNSEEFKALLKKVPPLPRPNTLLPPPANPVQGASNAVFGSLAQPFREAADAIGGRMSEQEAKDFAFNAAIGILPMGRGLQGVRMGAMGAPRAANAAAGKPATAFDDAMAGLMGVMGEVQPAPLKIPTAANYSQPGIRAYHGSPHKFDKFKTSEIGTGEGNQSYGHGLYFAENEGTALSYKNSNRVTDMEWPVAGTDLKLPAWVARSAKTPQGLDEVLENFRGRVAEAKAREAGGDWNAATQVYHTQRVVDALDAVKRGAKVEQPGHMYEVNIRAKPEQFLDWDRPLAQMNPEVQGALDKAWLAHPEAHAHQRGSQIYNAAGMQSGMVGGDASHYATRSLQEAGIPGIKYLDQGSRGASQGTSNFVLFDDKLIDILKKYGLAGMTTGGAAGASFGSLAPGEN